MHEKVLRIMVWEVVVWKINCGERHRSNNEDHSSCHMMQQVCFCCAAELCYTF